MIQATLDNFRDHGYADLGRIVDPDACAALLSEIRRRRQFDADMFLTERAFLASETVSAFDHLRAARLMAYLRQREPDDAVGYSILVYELTGQEVGAAMMGPPPEVGLPE